MKFVKYFLFLTLVLCETSQAQLKWETRNLEFHPSPGETQVVANFPFTNTGAKPVKIKEVHTSCGCTTVKLDKEVYEPGEKGKITAVFDVGGRVGEQKKTIYVATTAPKEPELVLTFTAFIPKILEIEPIFLNWQAGEELKPKIVNIKVLGDYPVTSLELTSTSPNMTAEVKHENGSRDFQVIVTPKKTDAALSAGIELKPDFPKDPPKYFHIYTRVDH